MLKCEQKQDASHHTSWLINSSKRKQKKSKANTNSLNSSRSRTRRYNQLEKGILGNRCEQ